MKFPLLKTSVYIAAFGMMAGLRPLQADSLTVEGDLNVEGKVAIGGTAAATEKLEVEGNVIVAGNLAADSITLPSGTLTAKPTALYNTDGTETLITVGESGKVNFANGLSIGTDPAATLTPSSAAYLNQTLASLGYRENSVPPTHITSIPTSGTVIFKDIVQVGSYVYVCGSIDGPGSVGGYRINTIAKGAFVAKVDLAGNAQWVKTIFDTNYTTYLYSVAVDDNGNVVVAGYFSGTTTGLTSPAINVVCVGSRNGLVVKYNASGESQWAQRVGGASSAYLYSVGVDGDGNVVVAGYFFGTTTGLTSPATNLVSAGLSDGIVVKYNASGASQWAQRVGGASSDYLWSVAVDGSGNVVVAGYFSGTTIGLASPAANLVSGGSDDGLVVKYNASGESQWAQRVGGASLDRLWSVAVDGSGNVVVVGSFDGTTTSLASPVANLVSGGSSDGLVVKYNASGESQWAQRVGGASSDSLRSVAVDGDGNVVVAGYFFGTMTGLTSPATNLVSAGFDDGMVVKYNPSGASQWAQAIGGTGSDGISRISLQGESVWVLGGAGSGGPVFVGDARIFGSYAIRWTGSPLVTLESGSSSSLAWGASAATHNGVALGSSAYASGDGSIALGAARAQGNNTFAAGSSSATATAATAMGEYTQANGSAATAMGSSTQASGNWATAMGSNTRANGSSATAMGSSTQASGDGSTAMGIQTQASGDGSIAMGARTQASGDFSTALGYQTTAQAFGSVVFGRYNIIQGDGETWVASDDLFVVGNGTSDTGRSNAFSIKKNGETYVSGSVGIGTATPAEKLEVVGNIKVTGGTLTTPSVTLPAGGSLSIYNGSGQAVTTIGTNGKVNFTNGISVGSGANASTLTPSGATFLAETLNKLGYREAPVAATPVRTIATTGEVVITAITQDANYVYVVGRFSGKGSIGGANLWANGSTNAVFVAKLTQAGVAQWAQTIQADSIALNTVAVDGSGNVIAAGDFSGTTTGLSSPAANLVSNGDGDAMVVKYDVAGQSQWAQRVGGIDWDAFTSVAVDGSGNVVAVGEFEGTTTGLSSPAANLTSNGSSSDAMVVKYNAAGQSQWAQRVGGTNWDVFTSVAVDGGGNVVAVGGFCGATTGLGSPAANLVSSGSASDAMVVKYNAAGQSQWAQRVGDTGEDRYTSVAMDGSGNVIAAGDFFGTTSGLSSPAANLTSNGSSSDAMVVKYNAAGQSQWAQRVGGTNWDVYTSVGVDGSGNVVAAGHFYGTTTGLSNPAANLAAVDGQQNAMIVAYDGNGQSQSSSRIGFSGSSYVFQISLLDASFWAIGLVDGGGVAPIGTTRVAGDYAVGWSNLPLITPDPTSASTLAWGGSAAQANGVALGSAAFATGEGSAALGTATASATNAFASGSSKATAEGAVAMGNGSRAKGVGSTAIGDLTSASGNGATAMGRYSIASGWGATAMGEGAYAGGNGATAAGNYSEATGDGATAAGNYSEATGAGATALGEGAYASGNGATAMGVSTVAQAYASTAVGILNIPQGNSTEWVPTDDLFVVGNGTPHDWTRSNAFVVRKNGEAYVSGYFGVGTSTPMARLDISGDAIISGTLTVAGQSVATADQLASYQLSTGSGAALIDIQASAITASGTRTAETFLRGDNTWAVPPGGGGGAGVTDGDKGDITVSGGGAVWTVDGLPWATIDNTPTTLTGYGITDALVAASTAETVSGTVTNRAVTPAALKEAGYLRLPVNAQGRVTTALQIEPQGDILMGAFGDLPTP